MTRKFATMLMLMLTLTAVTGCWSRTELNDIAITVALGIDKIGDRYSISAQIVNPSEVTAKKGGGGKGAPVVTHFETGETVFEAFRRMTTKTPRKLYFSHLRMLVVSETLAREGIGKALDILSRDHEFRSDFFIVVAKGVPAEKVLETYTSPQEMIPGNKMFKSLQNTSQFWATTQKVTLDEFISDLVSEGKQPVLASIDLTGGKDNEAAAYQKNVNRIHPITVLHISGLAVFKKDKLIGWLNEEESKAYNYIQGDVKNTVSRVSCPGGGTLSFEIIRTKAKMKGKTDGGKPEVTVELFAEGNVADVECEVDLTKPSTIDDLEKRAEKEIKDELQAAVNIAQKKYKADIFGFGEAVRRSDPRTWRQLKSDWEKEFADLPVKLNVDVKIRRLGTVTDSFLDKIKE